MGTLRLFEYPCPDNRLGELHLDCYTQHMNDIQIIKVNETGSYVVTTGLQDRGMILWKVDEQKTERELGSEKKAVGPE